ncbi:hypothetical protein [Wolbachia endosymbiont (group A) of Lasioglossum fulvicorne]
MNRLLGILNLIKLLKWLIMKLFLWFLVYNCLEKYIVLLSIR